MDQAFPPPLPPTLRRESTSMPPRASQDVRYDSVVQHHQPLNPDAVPYNGVYDHACKSPPRRIVPMHCPPPPILSVPANGIDMIQTAYGVRSEDSNNFSHDDLLRYLQFDCTLFSCKYTDPWITWGEIIEQDYDHFKELMALYLPRESKTFLILFSQLKPEDRDWAKLHTRIYDTPEYENTQKERYLSYKCTHKGKHTNKTWRDVRKDSYGYFKWAVQNTMGRETKTFHYLAQCLRDKDVEAVRASVRKERPQPPTQPYVPT